MAFGNIALILLVLAIYRSAGWSIADLGFWLVVGLLIGARYIDIVRYKGATIDGEPATMAHFRRYGLVVLFVGAALWAIARVLGPGFTWRP